MTANRNSRNHRRKLQAFELLGNGRAREARELLSGLSSSDSRDAGILLALGIADGMLGDFPAAEDSLRKATSIDPGQAEAHYNLGKALKAQNKLEQAADSLMTACKLAPENAAFHNDLANTLVMLGHHRDALDQIRQAVSRKPGVPSYCYNLGNVLTYLGLNDQAVAAYRQAISMQPDFRAARIAAGDALLGMGRIGESMEFYESILQENPEDPGALVGKASVLDKRGQFSAARDLLAPVLESGKVDAYTAATFAGFSHHLGREDEAVRIAERILATPDLRPSERARLCFSLGRIHDRNRRFEQAFRCYAEGNSLRRSDFSIIAHRQYIDEIITAFTPEYMEQAERARNSSEIPVFIVGMPRSGTSLVEQILASHPQVHGAGELEILAGVADSIPGRTGTHGSYSQAVHALTAELVDDLAEEYLSQLTAHNPAASRVTDKMPANFMLLGLIEILFPSARIIHCRRNPLDTCLSGFFQDFAGNHPYSNNLVALGEYYLEYERIMAHWQTLLHVKMFEVRYEELVTTPDSVVPDLIEFCGLEWEEACMEFHKSNRTVATASYDQVRQPLYTSSMQRWRHYEPFIGELIDILASAAHTDPIKAGP